jgi:hypothetical protein
MQWRVHVENTEDNRLPKGTKINVRDVKQDDQIRSETQNRFHQSNP